MDSLGQFKSNVARFNTVLVVVDVQPSRVPTKVAVRSALYFIFSSTFILSVFLIYFLLTKTGEYTPASRAVVNDFSR